MNSYLGLSDSKETCNNFHIPRPLRKGDKIALVSPASAVKEEYVKGAVNRIAEMGFEPILMPHALGPQNGSYSAICKDRFSDLSEAVRDDSIRAILCNRGGYGCVQLLRDLSPEFIVNHPKWIIGFSDISVLHALWLMSGVASIHGPMAKHLTIEPKNDFCTKTLFQILENGGKFDYTIPSSSHSQPGKCSGILRGGNMAVLNGLGATPYDIFDIKEGENVILFFEDVNEAIYSIERMLWRLFLSGTLNRVKGLIFGQFSDYKPDRNFDTMEQMIINTLEEMKIPPIPIVFDFPIGHVSQNYPLTEGVPVELEISSDFTRLKTLL